MPFTLDNVVPWGRSMEEYVAMFALSERELASSILGCADGPASFNAEMKARGRDVVCQELRTSGRHFEIKTVDYEFQRGGNRMLKVW